VKRERIQRQDARCVALKQIWNHAEECGDFPGELHQYHWGDTF